MSFFFEKKLLSFDDTITGVVLDGAGNIMPIKGDRATCSSSIITGRNTNVWLM